MRSDMIFPVCGRMPRYDCHVHKPPSPFYALQFVDGGGLHLVTKDAEYDLDGRWVWLIWPEDTCEYYPLDKYGYWSHRYIGFAGVAADKWRESGLLFHEPLQPPDTLDVAEMIDSTISLTGSIHALDRLLAINRLETLFIELARAGTGAKAPPQWLSMLKNDITAYPEKPPDYNWLAKKYSMSPRTLRRRFTDQVGVSMHAYHIHARIHRARELLEQTDMSIKEVASRLGYADPYFFNRQFKQKVGITPGMYRKHGHAENKPNPGN